jgi:hypothetical protein
VTHRPIAFAGTCPAIAASIWWTSANSLTVAGQPLIDGEV